jgi:uncharacterized membrane protein
MEARAKMMGHSLHQMLIAFPLGLLATAVVFDLAHVVWSGEGWATASFYMIAAGVIGGVAAAVFGLVDWLALPQPTRAYRVGLWHGLGNAVVLLLFAASWLLRREAPSEPGAAAIVLSVAGGGLALATAWLGGELVDRLGVGVDDGAHLDAPSSLSGRPARPEALR